MSFQRHLRATCLALLLVAVRPLYASEPSLDAAQIAQRVDAVSSRLDRLNTAQQALEKLTSKLANTSQQDNARIAANTQAAITAKAHATKELAKLVTPDMPATLSIADLNRQLKTLEKKRDELNNRVMQHQATPPKPTSPEGVPQAEYFASKQAIPFVLVKNHVVPGISPYYSFSESMYMTQDGAQSMVRVHRVSDGSGIMDAIKSDGILDEIIRKAGGKPETHSVMIYLCSDSISAFSRFTEAVNERGFGYSWQTFKDSDTTQSRSGPSAGGGWESKGKGR